ncbi:MAG TPA: altronate dehydratase family protein [Steroidobacteraceae bacterium]|nr:altronate dehydratase family protein [Steroidobacteraceae bacterium]
MAAEPQVAVRSVWRIDPRDDVAVALRPIAANERVLAPGQVIEALEPIPAGHKIALRPISAGEQVRKYGWPIGRARQAIACGAHVHSHNLATELAGVQDYGVEPVSTVSFAPAPAAAPTFRGYRRADGRVATRNEIWILPTVGCVNRTAEKLARLACERYGADVDGIHAFTHQFGCSQLGDDLDRTRGLIAALARHPNAGGVLVLGLGCESNQLDALMGSLGDATRSRIRDLAAQQSGDEIAAGMALLDELVAVAARDQREECTAAALTIGLKCGGSDGFSGITANPLVGRIADRVTASGGAAVLTEIPEIFGAEHLLMGRAASAQVSRDIATLVNGFKRYFIDHDQPVHENPSPGNIAGGITTLEEKSLGAVQKGGRATVTGVLRYGESVSGPGLALLESPGNDAVSATALVAAGANLLLFTTGRGTPLGFPVPTLKISSNSELAHTKPHWIDFDAGRVLSEVGPEQTADELMQLILATASGRPARNELNDEREIAIWKGGVTL